MRYLTFGTSEKDTYKYALLIKETNFREASIRSEYLLPLQERGIDIEEVVAFPLKYSDRGKCTLAQAKQYLTQLVPILVSIKVDLIYCADSVYFKALTKETKAEVHLEYVLKGKFPQTDTMDIIYGVNYGSIFYNPLNAEKLTRSLDTWVNYVVNNTSNILGNDVIRYAEYPDTVDAIAKALDKLHEYPELACDIETFSLKHWLAGIGTCAFAWSKHEGIAFCCDYEEDVTTKGMYGKQIVNKAVRNLLLDFFLDYEGTLVWHNGNFDIKVIIYVLWMDHIQDRKNMLLGVDCMTRHFDDTKLMAYVSLNSCAGNDLTLKTLAHEFAGNYAQDEIKDIRKIPKTDLLEYNLIDACCTLYCKAKYSALVDAEDQREVYEGIFKESAVGFLEIELTGMPVNMERVNEVDISLKATIEAITERIYKHTAVQKVTNILNEIRTDKDFEKRKEKAKKPEGIKRIPRDKPFNPASGNQISYLLYSYLGMPVIEKTDTGSPATDADTLKKLLNHTIDEEIKALLNELLEYAQAAKILSTYIPALQGSVLAEDGHYYLFGNYNITGTKSGRLSSSDPNLTNLPSGSVYGKLIKYCFQAHISEVFGGADFNSLESVINALLTNDPNKEKVLIEGFDSHSYHTYHYAPEEFPYVLAETPEQVNQIKSKDAVKRSESKPISFALQYFGTFLTLMRNCGLSKKKAVNIEDRFNALYAVSRKWVNSKLEEATHTGYVVLAFGLKLRTPKLSKVIWDSEKIPKEALSESRTAGNALSGQSYGLLNSRAVLEFMRRVRASKYRLEIKTCTVIHDAIYLRMANRYEVVEWVNTNLVECMQWQELPELQHEQIKLNAELDLFPSWDKPITLPNNANIETIFNKVNTFKQEQWDERNAK